MRLIAAILLLCSVVSAQEIDTTGALRGTDASGKRWKLQMDADPIPAVRDWTCRDWMWFRENGHEATRVMIAAWDVNWAWKGSICPTFPSGTYTVSGMRVDWIWTQTPKGLRIDLTGTPLTPGQSITGICLEAKNAGGSPKNSSSGGLIFTSQNPTEYRWWLAQSRVGIDVVKGSIEWECGGPALPLWDNPAGEMRAFSVDELPDVRPWLGINNGWGTNVCGTAVHRWTDDQVKTECERLGRLGFRSLRLAHFDSFGGDLLKDPTGFRRWLRLWPGTFAIDGLHFRGGDAWKGTVWSDPDKWSAFLNQREGVIQSIAAAGANDRVLGWVELNEQTVESPWYARTGWPPAERDAKAREMYTKAMSLPTPATWTGLKYRSSTQVWGDHPVGGLRNLLTTPCIAQNSYYTQPGCIESYRSMDALLDQHGAKSGAVPWVTEWNFSSNTQMNEDAMLGPIWFALCCVERDIEAAYQFAWTQGETGDRKPWELRLNASMLSAMPAAALIFSRRERGYTRADGTLRIDTGKTYGQVGRLVKDRRIVPGFGTGVIVAQELAAGKRLVTVLSRCDGTSPNNMRLEKVSAVIDGVAYTEGVHVAP